MRPITLSKGSIMIDSTYFKLNRQLKNLQREAEELNRIFQKRRAELEKVINFYDIGVISEETAEKLSEALTERALEAEAECESKAFEIDNLRRYITDLYY